MEIEYALARKDTLAIDPSVDQLLEALVLNPDTAQVFGNVEADNELAAHVLEIKCLNPVPDLVLQSKDFAASIQSLNKILGRWNACLMPGGMHPFMNTAEESHLWQHEDCRVYEAYDRIFGCRGHGWFNIQSVHLNLPFANDREFAALHNAISLLLPLLPALAAASPIYDGKASSWLDARLYHYIENQRRLPSIIGGIIPEPVGGEEEYREKILAPMFREIAPLDPEGLLGEEWLNSRAAIARFSRGAIEIRCMDTQERPLADLALCHWVTSVLLMVIEGGGDLLQAHRKVPTGLLKSFFLDSAQNGMQAKIPGGFPVSVFGFSEKEAPTTVREFLQAVTKRATDHLNRPVALRDGDSFFGPSLDLILNQGNLAERIIKSSPMPTLYPSTYTRLCECLEKNEPFL